MSTLRKLRLFSKRKEGGCLIAFGSFAGMSEKQITFEQTSIAHQTLRVLSKVKKYGY